MGGYFPVPAAWCLGAMDREELDDDGIGVFSAMRYITRAVLELEGCTSYCHAAEGLELTCPIQTALAARGTWPGTHARGIARNRRPNHAVQSDDATVKKEAASGLEAC